MTSFLASTNIGCLNLVNVLRRVASNLSCCAAKQGYTAFLPQKQQHRHNLFNGSYESKSSKQCLHSDALHRHMLFSHNYENKCAKFCLHFDALANIMLTSRLYSTSFFDTIKDGLSRMGYVLPSKYQKSELKVAAHILLNGVYMKVPHKEIRMHAELEDTFNMWVRVVYVHLWMLFARLKREGRDGEIMMIVITKMLWEDIDERLKKFEDEIKQNLKVREKMREYYQKLYTTFGLLDEGILGSDAHLASSLWIIIYSNNELNAEAWHLEAFVAYIRFAMAQIDAISMDSIVRSPELLKWNFPDMSHFT